MNSKKNNRRSLFYSVISLLLCVSMLMGTTLAWFSDSVSSTGNIIKTGRLKVAMEYTDDLSGEWKDASNATIFEGNIWEPGYSDMQFIRVSNTGNLAFQYQMHILPAVQAADGEVDLADVIDVYLGKVDGNFNAPTAFAADMAGMSKLGTLAELMEETPATSVLLPVGAESTTEDVGSVTYCIVLHMQETAGNEYQNLTVGNNFTVQLVASQVGHEQDAFGNSYDASAEYPELVFPEMIDMDMGSADVTVDSENKLTEDVILTGTAISATVKAGTLLNEGTTKLVLTVAEKDDTDANITLGENEELRALDVHVSGIADGNTVPVIISLGKVAPEFLNQGNLTLAHVENGRTVLMTQVMDLAELDAHNEFYYDVLEGGLTVAMATFSELAVVADTENAWEGKFDYTWYDASKTELTIANADQLAAFGAIVGGMNGQTQNSFAGKTVKLIADINLGDKESENNPDIIFYPIGYYNSEGTYERTNTAITSGLRNFEGTFDGNGHTISNFYHNTWEMKGDHDWYSPEEQYYRDGMGLFGRVYGGTIKNLTVKNFSSDGEIATTGVIAAYADGATFENIAIFGCNPRVYNIGNGGIVGCVGWYAKEADLKTTFKNITVDNSNKISALWGSYDVACGGLVGQYYPTSGQSSAGTPKNGGIEMVNCHVSAQMDVYNDVCANYQYYAYRYTGMLIGSVRENETIDGKVYPKMDGITASGCTVHFGTWNDYYYCEIIDNTTASYTHDYQMSRLTEIKAIDGTTITYLDGKTGTVLASGRANYVVVDYTKGHGTENATCYHFKDGAVWTHDMGGIQTGVDENGDGQDDLKEDKQHLYLEFNNLVTGYGWGVTSRGLANLDGVTNLDVTQGSQEESVEKFTAVSTTPMKVEAGVQYYVKDFFKEVDDIKYAIDGGSVQVFVSPTEENKMVYVNYEADPTNWLNGTLTFYGHGVAEIVITDYNFCKEATASIEVVGDSTLYRVGNAGQLVSGKVNENYDVTYTQIANLLTGKEGHSSIAVAEKGIAGHGVTSEITGDQVNFTGTGVIGVVIDGSQYFLEVVEAVNYTSASGSDGKNVVFLNDVKISSKGTAHYTNCTVYGNGFTFDVVGGMNQYNSKQGHGIIIAKYTTLDNLRIIGEVYDQYGMYSTDLLGNVVDDYTGAVDAEFCTIQNCYIANCATPVRSNGNTFINTTLYGGTVANLLISGGTNTLTNITTVNYNDTDRDVIGLGIVITDGADPVNTKLILNGYLKQYNFISTNDVTEVDGVEAEGIFNSMFDSMFDAYHITSNETKWVNTGIVSINESINFTADNFVDNANTGYIIDNDVKVDVKSTFGNTKASAAIASVPSTGKVDNGYKDNGTIQGDYLPTFNFNLGEQMQAKDNDDDTRYLIGDVNGLSAMYPKGEAALTLDLTKLATVTKYTNVSYEVSAKCVGPDGKEQTGTVTLDKKGTYTLVFTVLDNVFFDQNGNAIDKSVKRDYSVQLVLDLYEKSIADATMTISSSNLAGEYVSSGTNKKYKMYPLKAITSIMDDANKDGTLESFDFKKNIQSAVLTPASNNAFSSPTTITITYTGGQVLTIVLGTPSGLNSPGASNGGKTFSVKTDSTNGIYLQSDGAVASGSAVTGTWPLTSWSFKGTSGKVITDNTKVTINFTKPCSGCLAEGTLITLADGTQKPIEQITYEDELLAWDFHTGAYVATVPSLIEAHEADDYRVINLKFADGTVARVIVDHGFFDVEKNNYVVINKDNVASYVGHEFMKVSENGTYEAVELVDYEVTIENVSYYSIQTAIYNNSIADGMFTLPAPPEMLENDGWFDYFEIGEGMKYDEEKMQADIEKYGLYTYEDFAEYVTYEQFIAFNGPYLKVLVGRGVLTFEQIFELIATYVNP